MISCIIVPKYIVPKFKGKLSYHVFSQLDPFCIDSDVSL